MTGGGNGGGPRRSVRTLAWLGDAEFEVWVRRALAERSDLPADRLDAIKAAVVRAESQARALEAIWDALTPDERALAQRARNAAVRGTPRGDVRTYRAATAFEALVGAWCLGGREDRFEAVVGPWLAEALDAAYATFRRRPRRGRSPHRAPRSRPAAVPRRGRHRIFRVSGPPDTRGRGRACCCKGVRSTGQ